MQDQGYLKEIRDKQDEQLKATSDVREAVAVLSTVIKGHDRANEEYKKRTDKEIVAMKKQMDSTLDRVRGMEKIVNADSQNRLDMATFRSTAIKWVVGVLGSMILLFGGGVTAIAYQISQINGAG